MNPPVASVLINSALAIAGGFASIAIIALIARYAAGFFATDKGSRIAAFGVAVGYALGHFPRSSAASLDQLPEISAPLGAVVGLIAAWAWLLRRHRSELLDADA